MPEIVAMRKSKIVSCEAEVVDDRQYVPIVCSKDRSHFRSRRLFGPITIDPSESDTTDCLWTFMSDCLLNEAVVEELRSREFTGFGTDEVRMSWPSPMGLTYVQFRPIGWGGVASAASGIALTDRCDSCFLMNYSRLLRPDMLFDERQWDGSDVFMIWPIPKLIFVTRRLATVLMELKVTGMEFVETDELRIGMEGFTPGRLSFSMPQDRAQLLGRPLGID